MSTTAKQPLRVLMVEDNPADAELIFHELRRAGFDPQWERVDTEEDYRTALRPELDLILSDFHLPKFNGRRALEILQERGLELPFIILSGRIGEETAVMMMKQGATDYLLKDRPARLGEAVRRALREVQERGERRRAEEALQRSEERFRRVFEHAATGIAITDAEGNLRECNPAFCALVGRSEDELRGTRLRSLVHPDDVESESAAIRRLREEGLPFVELENRVVCRNGREVWVQKFISPIAQDKNGGGDLVTLVTDVSRRRLTESTLREAKASADAASQRKDLFLAMLSHELRTPLTPVLLTLGAWEAETGIAAEMRDDVAMMKRNLEHEVRLVDELLDISRITSGKVELRREQVDLNDAVRHVCGICQNQLREKQLELLTELDPAVSTVSGDATRLRQVLWNLLENAIKFTPAPGVIRVSTSCVAPDRCAVRVTDSGVGIDEPALARIFNAFEQVDMSITRRYGGLGLGLAIAKSLVELHGGAIRAESEGPGRGATFIVEFPRAADAARPSASVPTPAPTAGGAGLRLLIAEDNADTARVLKSLLGKSGHTVTLAPDVATAVSLAETNAFDLLISDIGLPDGTGYELLTRIRAMRPLPAIAMSGFGMDDDLRQSREAGFSLHLVKPVNMAKLRAGVAEVWQQHQRTS